MSRRLLIETGVRRGAAAAERRQLGVERRRTARCRTVRANDDVNLGVAIEETGPNKTWPGAAASAEITAVARILMTVSFSLVVINLLDAQKMNQTDQIPPVIDRRCRIEGHSPPSGGRTELVVQLNCLEFAVTNGGILHLLRVPRILSSFFLCEFDARIARTVTPSFRPRRHESANCRKSEYKA